MNKAILVLVLAILIFILLFALNVRDPFDPLINPEDYVDEIVDNFKNFYK